MEHCCNWYWMLTTAALLLFLSTAGEEDEGLRSLLLNERNQVLIEHLGTRYEVVHPFQVRRNWAVQGLSTRIIGLNGTISHTQETTLLLETYEHKLQLELELNTKLFAPTLVQLLYLKDAAPIAATTLPENCYYHARVLNQPEAKAAFQTCDGIRGVIYLGKKMFFIHPLHGNHSGKHPHLLYHYYPEEPFHCGNSGLLKPDSEEDGPRNKRKDEATRNKYIEIALVLDQTLFQKFQSPPSQVLAAAVEIINYVDLLYRPLNTSVSLVYTELWIEDQVRIEPDDLQDTLSRFQEYAFRRISRISVDTTHLITGAEAKKDGEAYPDSICTNKAVGITKVSNIFEPHLSSFVLGHMIGHNLGMNHDRVTSDCECSGERGCIMGNNMSILSSTLFSPCSVLDYHRTLEKGYGACLYNMPTLRMSICGNSVLEEPEQCDCGTAEECAQSNPCCDPMTCRLIKHAKCSTGPCCRKCKLLSPDHLCRPSRGECDIPEFCDGEKGECPNDLFKKNGAVCSGGLGYCYHGDCPVLKHQCQEIWGKDAEAADSVCFERLNVQGTPNGNCGVDAHGEIIKCSVENSYCGFLQCSQGEKTPASQNQLPPLHFTIHKINDQGTVHECKARTFSGPNLREGLVRDGTKCGYQQLCINQTCTGLKSLVSGKCPLEDLDSICSNHGICTNVNSCFCDEGWKGGDCEQEDEEVNSEEYYVSAIGKVHSHNTYHDEEQMKLNPNLAITVIAASIVIGVGLVIIVIFIFFYKHS